MPEKKEAAADEAGIEERIRALDRMTTGELADEYERLHRRECRTRHRWVLPSRCERRPTGEEWMRWCSLRYPALKASEGVSSERLRVEV